MLDALKKVVKGFIYPYKHTKQVSGKIIRFVIGSDVEKFRVQQWGGEEEYTKQLIGSLNEDDVFFDIGASVGLISVIAGVHLTKGKVVSFEPDPEIASRLKDNYEENNLSNFNIQNIAVGNEPGKLKLFSNGIQGNSPSLKNVNGIGKQVEVDVKTIDSLVESGELPSPTAVKIDIEGAEMMALQGMEAILLSENKPRAIFVEVHPQFLPDFGTSAQEVLDFVTSKGYEIKEQIERDGQILVEFVKGK